MTHEIPGGTGAATAVSNALPSPGAVYPAVDGALALRDEALAALDGGEPQAALAAVAEGMATLAAADLGGGADAAALLVARAEIEEALDRFAEARATCETAVIVLDSVGADGDDDTVLLWCQAQERLAGLDRLAGRFEAATTRLGAVLERAVATWGETSRAVVSAANALGVVGKYASDFDAAAVAYRRALAALDGGSDPDPLARAALLHNLGGLAHSRGDPDAGIPLAEQGLALRVEVLGGDHLDVARDLNALGSLYHLAGRWEEAAAVYGRALAIFEDRLGFEHFEVAMTCANLAVLAGDEGHYAKAETLGRRSLRLLEAILGPDDAEVGLTVLNLSMAVANLGRPGEAAALAGRAWAILSARLPAHHPHVAAAAQARASLPTAT
jgi:tetratricopeptide (TPR) repeat protein